jgi:hypothetical protein
VKVIKQRIVPGHNELRADPLGSATSGLSTTRYDSICLSPAMYAHYSGDRLLTNLKNIRVAVRFYFLRKSRLGYYEKSQTFQGHEAVNMSIMVNFVRAYYTTAPTCAVFNIIPRVLLIQLISSICGGSDNLGDSCTGHVQYTLRAWQWRRITMLL